METTPVNDRYIETAFYAIFSHALSLTLPFTDWIAQVKNSFLIVKSIFSGVVFSWCWAKVIIISALYGQIALSITTKGREDNSVCVIQAVDAQWLPPHWYYGL